MAKTIGAADLRERVGFYRPVTTDDGFGNVQVGFAAVPEFSVAAAIVPKLGGEAIISGRLAGKNYDNVTVRTSSQTRDVTTAWKVREERTGVDYNIRSIIDPAQGTPDRGRFLEMLCEKGVAT
jgi:head-tail adaptor